jgi:tetratricopeptide (TPR) repeat protein
MDVHPPGKALALALVDDAAPANAEAKRDLRITTADEFLIAAAKEYQDRQIDHALWRRAVDQCGGDTASVIPAYLRARATALKLLQKEDERSQKRAHGAGVADGARDRRVESEASPRSVSTKIAGARPRGARLGIKYAAAGAATFAFIVAVAWLIASPRENESVRTSVAATVPAPGRSAPPTPRGSDQPVVRATTQDSLEPPLEVRVQELKKAGNWNILVLYASEWTRKDPKNAAAWHELSLGYANLRQFGDALDAARKAVELAPEGSSLWSNLGRVNLAVQRLPEAAIAFDRALALNPDDPDALCGAASVAQRQGRPNDADALARRVKSADEGCRDLSDTASVTAVGSGSMTRKPVRPASR